MRLSTALEDKKLDLRLRDKLLAEGKLSQKDMEDYINSLPDDAQNATHTGEETASTES
jgi:polyhydroxyalkanoate synthesis regulator phasin